MSAAAITVLLTAQSRLMTMVFLVLGVLGTALILWVTPQGVGVSNSDSVNYVKAAQSLIAGNGLRGFDGGVFVRWPPLFPAVIALPMLAGLSGLESVRVVNALTFGLVVVASGFLFRQVLQSTALAILGTICVLAAWPLFLGAYFAFAETLFILLTVLFFLVLWPFLQRPGWQRLTMAAGIAALLCLQRYLGVAFVAAGALAILLLAPRLNRRQRLRYAVVFSGVALLPLALWGLRNSLLVGSLAGGGWASQQHRMHQVAAIGLGWLWPDAAIFVTDDPTAGAILTVGFALLLGLAAALVSAWQRTGRVAWDTVAKTPTAPIALAFPSYTIIFTILADNLQISLNDRVLSPAYLPMMTLILVLIDGLIAWLGRRRGRVLAAAPLVLLVLWLARPVARLAREAETLRRDFTALDLNHPNWQQDALIAWLNANNMDGTLYSNAALSVALLTDEIVRIAPMEMDDWDDRTAMPFYLAWYRDVDQNGCYHAESTRLCFNTDYTIDDLQQRFEVEPVTETDQGGIYRLTDAREQGE